MLARAGKVVESEGGFTMTELLVSTVLGLMVVGAGVAVFTSGIRNQPRIDERAAQIQQARVMTDRVTRELRQGSNASSTGPSQLMILTYVPHTPCGSTAVGPATRCRVFYNCSTAASSSSCTRVECPPEMLAPGSGCGATATVASGLMSNQVFGFSPRTPGQAYVGVTLALPADHGDDAITIQDGVALRNPPLGGP
jgi:type II secretory pathway pseudopilin PulG